MSQNISDSLFDELENFGKEQLPPKKDTGGKAIVGTINGSAMNRLLKEASEFEEKTQKDVASSNKSNEKGDFNEGLLDGPRKKEEKVVSAQVQQQLTKVETQKAPEEPLGYIHNTDGKPQVVHDDPYLAPFTNDLFLRQNEYKKWLDIFQGAEGGLENIARSYKKFGLHLQPNNDINFMEWCPGAKSLAIFGDFNAWNRGEFKAQRNEYGCFCITLKALEDGTPRIKHKQKYKIHVEGADGTWTDKNSAWAVMQVQGNTLFDCMHWNPPAEEKHVWEHIDPVKPANPDESVRIYESHVGMAQEDGKVSSYREYAEHILPRVKKAGYNVIQLMAIQEHAYYGSFGYHVTGFFGISSRQGTPDDFKFLVDKAHGMGIKIVIDLVHSHASNNVFDGINKFDGTDHSFSHGGARGYHSGWDSMLFDYSKYEVKRFLLSNLAWFLDEYHVDGFRFDAVTSILYNHHGIGFSFSGNYHEYFGMQTDLDGITYLMLANTLVHKLRPGAITIAEDVSGHPTLCRTIRDGGIGFDYRLGMFLPDMWIKLLKETPDEDWNMAGLVHAMTNRRWLEKVVAYSESHDQAIVGDKTQSMHLFDQEIYHGMDRRSQPSLVVSRGMALHKMIRLITQSLGGEAYLNFMGNEFGHPEWIDFPREGNNNSYHYCRRQWSLLYNQDLRFGQLGAFDEKMCHYESIFSTMIKPHQFVTLQNEEDKVIVYERGELVYVFNFHSNNSYTDYLIGTHWRSDHFILMETDDNEFGGHQRLNDGHGKWLKVMEQGWSNRRHSLKLYIPSRCAIVLVPFEFAVKHKDIKMPHYEPTDPAFSCYLPRQADSLASKKEEQKASVDTKVEEKKEEPKAAETKPEEKPSAEKEVPKPKEKKKLIDLMEDLTLA